jgi:sugar lactone lactonase YvrE
MAASGVPVRACEVGATLGEGPFWSARDRKLWFVDIKGLRIHRFDPESSALDSWPAPAQPGWLLAADDGRLVTGLQTGLHFFDPRDGSFTPLAAVEPKRPGNRLNDATVDGFGRLWFGSMDDGERAATGRVYVYDHGRIRPAPIEPVAITNGPAFSPDGRTLYHVDTLGGTVHAFDVAPDGSLGRGRLFAQIDPKHGYPDGPTVDGAGCLWIGLYSGWGARRYSPEGALIDYVRFPVANVTKIAIGGPDMRTAYATTAHKGLSPAARAEQAGAGDLFSFRVDVPGLPLPPIAI